MSPSRKVRLRNLIGKRTKKGTQLIAPVSREPNASAAPMLRSEAFRRRGARGRIGASRRGGFRRAPLFCRRVGRGSCSAVRAGRAGAEAHDEGSEAGVLL